MKKAIKWLCLAALVSMLITSCITQEKCLQRFPPQIITKDSTVYKDSLMLLHVPVLIPGDYATFRGTLPCPGVIYHQDFKSESGKMTGTLDLKNGDLMVRCQMDSLQKIVDSLILIKQKEIYRTETKVIEKPVIKYKMPSWCWWILIALIACLCWIFRKPLFYIIQKIISPIKIV